MDDSNGEDQQSNNEAIGCGCLVLAVLVIGGIAWWVLPRFWFFTPKNSRLPIEFVTTRLRWVTVGSSNTPQLDITSGESLNPEAVRRQVFLDDKFIKDAVPEHISTLIIIIKNEETFYCLGLTKSVNRATVTRGDLEKSPTQTWERKPNKLLNIHLWVDPKSSQTVEIKFDLDPL